MCTKVEKVTVLVQFYRLLWAQDEAVMDITLRLFREGDLVDVVVHSADRYDWYHIPIF